MPGALPYAGKFNLVYAHRAEGLVFMAATPYFFKQKVQITGTSLKFPF
jgi:hypothetical protein